jgi:hypothetical protein
MKLKSILIARAIEVENDFISLSSIMYFTTIAHEAFAIQLCNADSNNVLQHSSGDFSSIIIICTSTIAHTTLQIQYVMLIVNTPSPTS